MYRYKCYSQFRSKYQSFECYIGKENYFTIEWMGKEEGVNMIQEKKHKFTNKGTKLLFLKSPIFFYAPEHGFNLLEDKIGKTLLCV